MSIKNISVLLWIVLWENLQCPWQSRPCSRLAALAECDSRSPGPRSDVADPVARSWCNRPSVVPLQTVPCRQNISLVDCGYLCKHPRLLNCSQAELLEASVVEMKKCILQAKLGLKSHKGLLHISITYFNRLLTKTGLSPSMSDATSTQSDNVKSHSGEIDKSNSMSFQHAFKRQSFDRLCSLLLKRQLLVRPYSLLSMDTATYTLKALAETN